MDTSKNYALLSKTSKGARESPLLCGYDASERLKRLKRLSVFLVNDTEVPDTFAPSLYHIGYNIAENNNFYTRFGILLRNNAYLCTR